MKIIGHEKQRSQFKSLIKQGKFAQTNLFYGPAGIGKKLVAMELVQALLCDNTDQGENLFGEDTPRPCGQCAACQRVESETHPDFILVKPTPTKSAAAKPVKDEVSKNNWTIKVEDVVTLSERLKHHPLQGKYQVVIIDDADKMTTATANKLLKMLEEPRPTQIFILVTSILGRVLTTIRSRAAKTYFAALTLDQVREILKINGVDVTKVDTATLDFFIACFQGSLGPVQSLIETGVDLTLVREMAALNGKSFIDAGRWVAKVLESGTDLNLFLSCLKFDFLNRAKMTPNTGVALASLDKIDKAKLALSRHVQAQFVLENLTL